MILTPVSQGSSLGDAVAEAAFRFPGATAVEETGGTTVSYTELLGLADRTSDALKEIGVRSGDRVGVYMPKSIDAIGSLMGVLRAGAAYVPIDPRSPPSRAGLILDDCQLSAVFAASDLVESMRAAPDAEIPDVPLFALPRVGGGEGLSAALDRGPVGARVEQPQGPSELAYILYTSGSTGRPKGVMLSHANALSFVSWCSREFEPTSEDRFSSHAPLHFDLSILDLFLPLTHGSTVVLFGAEEGRNPKLLADRLEESAITSWYSAPSILTMLCQFGRLESRDLSSLQRVLFAGEVFPIKHLRTLKGFLPDPAYYNLYGPTETNVCTWYRIPDDIPEDREQPYPIGEVCDHFRARVIDDGGATVRPGDQGELCIAGAGVMMGYWRRPEENERAFLPDTTDGPWYRTGDVVQMDSAGAYLFHGRRDRMVKRRGYRIELGEVEAALIRHPTLHEVAAVSVRGPDGGVRIRAVVACGEEDPPTIVALKRFSSEVLPSYMVPDEFVICKVLPKTSTDKVDLTRLTELT